MIKNISGIYKWTSPSGKVYVGQSLDLKRRLSTYKQPKQKRQPKLYNSFKKYGVGNHEFEILEECSIESLNVRERYWQDYYDVLGINGLNCRLTGIDDRTGKLSEETIEKMKKSALMLWKSDERRKSQSILTSGSNNGMYGKKELPDNKERRINAIKNHYVEHPETRDIHRNNSKERWSNSTYKEKMKIVNLKSWESEKRRKNQKIKLKEYNETHPEFRKIKSNRMIGNKNPFYGKSHDDKTKELLRQQRLGCYWVNNGIENKYLHKHNIIPEGFVLGMKKKIKNEVSLHLLDY